MSEKNWLESRKKNSCRNALIVLLIVVASASFIFIRNNRELLFSKQERISRVIVDPPPSKPAVANLPVGPSAKATPIIKSVESMAGGTTDSVTISDFACRVREKGALRIVLSLKLVFSSAGLKREVLLKREDLKVMVRKIIAAKSINELNIDSLRDQTKRAMNRILEKTVITDVEFRNFNIEKVQQP